MSYLKSLQETSRLPSSFPVMYESMILMRSGKYSPQSNVVREKNVEIMSKKGATH